MPEIKIMIGLPRSGKSTWIEKNKTEKDVVLCADKLRYLVYNQRFWNDGEPLMWSVHGVVLRMLLEQGKDIIIDETNVSVNRRKPLIELAKKYGYKVIGVWVRTSKETCLDRAVLTNDEVIPPVIHRMWNEWQTPEIAEGLNEIVQVN